MPIAFHSVTPALLLDQAVFRYQTTSRVSLADFFGFPRENLAGVRGRGDFNGLSWGPERRHHCLVFGACT